MANGPLRGIVSRRLAQGSFSDVIVVDLLECGHEVGHNVNGAIYPGAAKRACPTCAGDFKGPPGTFPIRVTTPR